MKKFLLLTALVSLAAVMPLHSVHATIGAVCTNGANGTPAISCSTGENCDYANGDTGNCVSISSGFVPLVTIPGLTDNVQANQKGLADFLNNLYKFLIGIAAALAVIQITWSGIELAVNKENVSKMLEAKGKIYNAIFGLVLILAPALVFAIINPSILNLSLNLEPLNLTHPMQMQKICSGGASNCTTVNSTGLVTSNPVYQCSGSDCSDAQKKCPAPKNINILTMQVIAQTICVNKDGTIGQNGPPCAGNQTLSVECSISYPGSAVGP